MHFVKVFLKNSDICQELAQDYLNPTSSGKKVEDA
jgi:hypothetical protein